MFGWVGFGGGGGGWSGGKKEKIIVDFVTEKGGLNKRTPADQER